MGHLVESRQVLQLHIQRDSTCYHCIQDISEVAVGGDISIFSETIHMNDINIEAYSLSTTAEQPMKTALRDLKDDLQMCLMRLIEIEQHVQGLERGDCVGAKLKDSYKRTFTGTFRGTQRELGEL